MPSQVVARDVQGHRAHGTGADGHGVVALVQLLEGDVAADPRVEVEGDAQAFHELEVHLDGVTRQPEGRHADQHRAAGHGQLVVDGDLVSGHGQLAGHGQPGRPGTDDRDRGVTRRDEGHLIRDARLGMPLDEEALHGADGQRAVDVAAAAGPLAGGRADVGTHGRHRVGLTREDVALLETPLGGQVEVATAVGAHWAGFLAFDVALQPGRVHGLDEELLVALDDHAGSTLLHGGLCGRSAGWPGWRRIYHRRSGLVRDLVGLGSAVPERPTMASDGGRPGPSCR